MKRVVLDINSSCIDVNRSNPNIIYTSGEKYSDYIYKSTDGDKPVPATLTYVPSDIREEEKLLNNENATAGDFLSLDWDDWTVHANGKEMNSFEAIKHMFS